MHIPDGFLSVPVWATLDVAAVPAVGYMARQAQRRFDDSRVPLLGVLGAFVFAAQMINFPVGVGTSSHLVGSALLAFTLGPAAAGVVMTAILAIQALVFQDGGVLALGANVMNMAVIGVLAAYLPYKLWGAGRMRKAAIFAGGVLSLLVGALLAIAQLLLSGVPMPAGILGLSFGLFLISALLEGGITLAVIQALETINPDFVRIPAAGGGRLISAIGLSAILIATVGALFASAYPDGLESLAEQVGIAERARVLIPTPLADYQAAFVEGEWLRQATAGIAGLLLIFAICIGLGRFVMRRKRA